MPGKVARGQPSVEVSPSKVGFLDAALGVQPRHDLGDPFDLHVVHQLCDEDGRDVGLLSSVSIYW